MPHSHFSLKPFVPANPEPFKINGDISRKDDALHVTFSLSGPLDLLLIPLRAKNHRRKDNLWKETCFEFFLAEVGSETYREVNLAPSGHWNVYRFDHYRQGMRREENVTSLPFHTSHNSNLFSLKTVLNLGSLHLKDKPLQIGISVVLLSKSNILSYWALAHPCDKPDFHDRKGFFLNL